MKLVIFNVFLILAANTAFAKDYICRGSVGEPLVKIVEVNGSPQFQYFTEGQSPLYLNMDKAIIQPVTSVPIGIDAGQTFTFRPNLGETMVHVYGKIRSWGAVFDIFVLGMLGNVQKTLVDYQCSVMVAK